MIEFFGFAFAAFGELFLLALQVALFLCQLIALLVITLIERVLRLFGKQNTSFGTELRFIVKTQRADLRQELRSGLRVTALFAMFSLMLGGAWLGWHFGTKRPVSVVMDGKPASVAFEMQSWTGTRMIQSGTDGQMRVPRFWDYTLTTRGLMEEPQYWTADQVGAQITVKNEPMGVSLLKKAAGAVKEKLAGES